MNFNFRNILPKSVDNKFKGHKLALWGFILFLVLMTWRSIIHMLFEQGYASKLIQFGWETIT